MRTAGRISGSQYLFGLFDALAEAWVGQLGGFSFRCPRRRSKVEVKKFVLIFIFVVAEAALLTLFIYFPALGDFFGRRFFIKFVLSFWFAWAVQAARIAGFLIGEFMIVILFLKG